MTVVAVAVAAVLAGGGLGLLARYVRVPGGPWATRGVDVLACALVALIARLPLLDGHRALAVIAYLAAFVLGRLLLPPLPRPRADEESVN